MGENKFAKWPVAGYGLILLFAAAGYFVLTRTLISLHGRDSVLATAPGNDFKGKISVVIYVVAILASIANRRVALAS